MSKKPGGKTYSAGVKEYRSTYWEPNYSVKETDILACFKITPQPGVDREGRRRRSPPNPPPAPGRPSGRIC